MEGTQVTERNGLRVTANVLMCTHYSTFGVVVHIASWAGCNDCRIAQQEKYGRQEWAGKDISVRPWPRDMAFHVRGM